MTTAVQEELTKIVNNIASAHALEVVDVNLFVLGKRSLIKIFLHKEGGVSIGDCQKFSRELEVLLEAEGIFENAYTLEVSSPGLDRPLKNIRDFERQLNKRLEVKFTNLEEKTQSVVGVLVNVQPTHILLEIKDAQITIPFEKILKAVIHIDF